MRRDSLFLVLLLTKKKLWARVGVDPERFDDLRGVTREYKGWFFKKERKEKGVSIGSEDDLDYALHLVGQAYKQV